MQTKESGKFEIVQALQAALALAESAVLVRSAVVAGNT
jgi:hypothetical protein